MNHFTKRVAVVVAAVMVTFSAHAQGPGGVGTNLSIWLKANSGPEEAVGNPAESGDVLTRWLDQSSSGLHYIPVTGPTLLDDAINFNPAVQILSGGFDAPAGSELTGDWTIITVSKKLASDQDGRLFDGHISNYLWSHWNVWTNSLYLNGNPANHASGIATTTGIQNLHLHTYVRTNATGAVEARADGNTLTTFGSSNSAAGIRIDINTGAYSNAGEDSDSHVGEMIVYSRALTPAELLRVESYLAVKYGLTVSHNYVTSSGTTVWDFTVNSAFNHDIAGIGRDDNSALDQQKSKSINANSWITIDKGGAFPADGSYIVWGDNNGIGQTSNVPSAFSYRSSRVWKTAIAGTPGTATFSIDLSTAGFLNTGNAADYALLLDGDGDFSTGATSHTTGASLVGNTLTFTSVPFAHNQYFTIARSFVNGPGGVTVNMATWLKADGDVFEGPADQAESGDAITTWQDMSGLGHHYTGVAGPTLQASTLNFNPSVEILTGGFDAPVGAELGTEWTTFFVSRKLASDVDGRLFDGHAGNNLWAWWSVYTNSVFFNGNPANHNTGVATTAGLTNLHLHAYKRQSTGELEARVEGTSLNTFGTSNSTSGIRIDIDAGAFAAEHSDARVGEVIIYNSALNATEVNKVESYLAIKYGITLTHDYLASDATVVWNNAANSGFNNDITGIGRDDASSLNQIKSTTINSSNDITIDKGGAIGTDKSFLMWGNNGATGFSTNIPSTYNIRTSKIWKAAVTGSPGVVSFSVNLSSVGIPNTGSASDYTLLIDTDTDFSSGATPHSTGASVVGNVLTFTNVSLSDNNFFAVAAQNLSIPGGTPGLVFWVKADVGVVGAPDVSQWSDQSGFGNNAVQGTPANQPDVISNVINTHPVVEFASGDVFAITNSPANLNSTVFTVAIPQVNSNWRTMFRGAVNDHPLIVEAGNIRLGYYDGDNGGFRYSGFNWLQNEIAIVGLEMRAGDVNFRKNGTQGTSITSINLANLRLDYFGNYQVGTQPFGRIAETIIYNSTTPITTTDKEKIESYLGVKYGITLSHSYLATDGSVTWDVTTNAAFSNNIVGIGRDDVTTLDQQKSASVNTGAGLTIDKGGAFGANKTFLLIGNDGGSATSTNVPSPYIIRSGRLWKVATTNAPGTISISVDLNTLSLPNTGNAADYALLKDTDTDLGAGGTAHTTGASLVGNILSFTNVTFSNDDVFAFAVSNVALPGGIAGLAFWVKGETGVVGTTDVSQWTDQSGFNNDAVQATPANQPALISNSINFRDVVDFSVSSDMLTLTAPPVTLNSTIFAIGAPLASSNWRTMFRGQTNDHPIIVESGNNTRLGYFDGDGGGFKASGFNWVPNEVALVSLEMRAGDVNFRKNGAQGSSIATINLNTNIFAFGNYQAGAQPFGRIAETIIFNTTSPLSLADKEKIESYLGLKYGITLSHDYTASDGTVFWNTTANSGYNNNIIGVGRDDNSSLNQTKSLSVHANASITVESSGAIATNNSFLVFGNDAGTGTSVNVPAGLLLRSGRIWKASVIGTPGTVSVSFNLVTLGLPATGSATDFVVLVDNDTDFSSGATQHSTGATLVGNTLTFTNLSLSDDTFFTLAAATLIQPGGLSGSVFWVKGDVGVTGTTDVSRWADQSGGGNDAVQASSTLQPTLVATTINSHAVVDFNSVSDYMNITTPPAAANSTAFIVAAPRNNGNYRTFLRSAGSGDHLMLLNNGTTALGYWDQNTSPNFKSSSFTWAQNEIAVVALEMRTGDVNFRKNGSQGTSITAIDLTGLSHNYFGGYPGGSQAPGRIAETIIFSTPTALSTSDKQKIETYLAVKYGITLTHNYITTTNTVVWNSTTNATYHNDVAGIGRDDATGLDQRKSASNNALTVVTVDLGGPFGTNGSYLVWGNNTGAMSSVGVTDLPTGIIARLARVWKSGKTGVVAPVSIQFDLSTAPGAKTASDLRLLIDRNLNGVFSDETVGGGGIISGATDMGGSVYGFSGVTLNDGELFTVGSAAASTPLPINLLSFDAKVTSAGIDVDWTTSQEINNDYFTVERTADGLEFLVLADVQGAGTSSHPNKYTYLDSSPLPGKSFYRLKQTDFNKNVTLSKIISVVNDDLPVLYPNPATNEVSIDTRPEDQVTAEIVNAIGQRIYLKHNSTPGRMSWNVESLPRGIYFMTILRNNTLTTQKLILTD